jgi:cell division protease FtsH
MNGSPQTPQNPAKPTIPPNARPFGGMPPRKSFALFALIFLANYLLIRFLFPGEQPVTVPYTEFRQQVAGDNVSALYSRGNTIEGRFRQPVTWPTPEEVKRAGGQPPRPTALDRRLLPPPKTSTYFTTELPAFHARDLEGFLIQHNVEISAVPIQQGGFWTTLLYFGPALLIIAFYVWMYRRATQGGGGLGGGMFGLGRSKAKRYDATDPANRITFNDVAGIDEAEAELVEIVDFLKAPDKYTRLGGTAPKGVLLIGAPGTGKTLLAKAVAGEAGVPFFSMSAAEFVEMIVGVGAARVRDLFKQARESAPAIIFIDEIDAIGRARGGIAFGGGHSEQEQTLQQILTEMDGFTGREGIIVLAATNTPDVLDRALLRPGRFDRRVVVNLPDKAGREAILRVHVRKTPLAADVRLEELAQATPGFSGADLKNLVNEAALLAARRNEGAVTHKDFLDALEKIVLGPERPLLLTEQDRERIAYHESGHAILGLVVAGADPVHRVSIVPRGQALGVTYQRPQTDRYNYPEAYLRARIIGMLGGRAAEEVVYGTKTTGAENDIEQATQMARNMVTRWGMSEAVGMVQLAPRENRFLGTAGGFGGDKPFSEQTAALIDAEVQRIIHGCHEEAKALLHKHRKALDGLVAALLQRETLSEQEILQATGLPPAPQLEGAPLSNRHSREGANPVLPSVAESGSSGSTPSRG